MYTSDLSKLQQWFIQMQTNTFALSTMLGKYVDAVERPIRRKELVHTPRFARTCEQGKEFLEFMLQGTQGMLPPAKKAIYRNIIYCTYKDKISPQELQTSILQYNATLSSIMTKTISEKEIAPVLLFFEQMHTYFIQQKTQ